MQALRSPIQGILPDLENRFGRRFALDLFERGNFSRHFELKVKEAHENKQMSIPIYLSLGTEFNSAALSLMLPKETSIFGQHRCHSLYLNFGGNPERLRDELLGKPTGCSGGMGGSNCIQAPEINYFGHAGLMGEQVPIAVGAALASGKTCLTICGDASVEEDYIYPSLGFAATRKLPILFICEDNNLSILTPVEVRRSWSPVDVARSMGMAAIDITDDPWLIAHHARECLQALPAFINIRTVRHLWHAGTGSDGAPEWNRYERILSQLKNMGLEDEIKVIDKKNEMRASSIWEKAPPRP